MISPRDPKANLRFSSEFPPELQESEMRPAHARSLLAAGSAIGGIVNFLALRLGTAAAVLYKVAHMHDHNQPADAGGSQPGTATSRRDFLRLSALTAASVAMLRLPAMAGPFTRADFEKLVPADKKLSETWVKSLFARGSRTVYRGTELEKIGMPIGGICAGQVYLGGDGKLWHWDIFNRYVGTGAEHYAKPLLPSSPLDQGFAVKVTAAGRTWLKPLDRSGWPDIAFTGEYPIGYIEYRDPNCPVRVKLEAFSPFIPLNTDDSSLPATVMQFTVTNGGDSAAAVEVGGWLENAVCRYSAETRAVIRQNRTRHQPGALVLEYSAVEPPPSDAPKRPDILFDDFEGEAYDGWTTTGAAFGKGPVAQSQVPDYQGNLGMHGERAVNSHAAAPGNDVGARDAQTGTLTSRPFTIERNYVNFLIGGGAHAGRTCLNLLVDDQVVASATSANDNRLQAKGWDVRRWQGKTARLQAVDNEKGGWGNIGVDDLVFSDSPHRPVGPLAEEPDFGTMALALLGEDSPADSACATVPGSTIPADVFTKSVSTDATTAARPAGEKLVGSLIRKLTLGPGESQVVTFVIAWHFPNLKRDRLPPGRYYATRFDSAPAVAVYVAKEFARLSDHTRLWHDTWYDSTLPYWFLDRTFLNTSILATSTCHRFGTGRFWGWEGVGCCHGTCGHVWQYAHAVARLFPKLERITREHVDFGFAQQPNGAIFFRGEFNDIPAIDAQAGTILRALREHQMSADDAFLKRNWPQIRRAIEWLIAKDENGDGFIEGNQHNTLDTDWFGPVAWLSGLYHAALRAGEAMADELGDHEFAQKCHTIFDAGSRNLVGKLFAGEYFINKPDPKHLDAINSGTGCEIDQVMGQSWAWQVGLGRILPEKETVSALKSLWRYNFTPDVGPYREAYKAGRWYAMAGEAGLLMCTFPRADWDCTQAKGKGADWAAGYFNECMNGFEYQAAGHMIWEGLLQEGLAVTRAVHDRYHPTRRNPWNEVECGDHYARSMASYGVYLAACGFEYHGPKGHLGFAPRLTPEDFQCAFTTAEGWGTFTQKDEAASRRAQVTLKWGRLRLRTLSLTLPASRQLAGAEVVLGQRTVSAQATGRAGSVLLVLNEEVEVSPELPLSVQLALS